MPSRIQRSRKAGARMPKGAIYVGRPTRFGNPFKSDGTPAGLAVAAAQFRLHLKARREHASGWIDLIHYPSDAEIREVLGGKDLACWCPLPEEGKPDICHAATLLLVANGDDDA